ncbi:MAG: STM4014 family protein [Ardenticatenales bacterium]|nr:STM4014 family protein [Ardenticatenales bacterium]
MRFLLVGHPGHKRVLFFQEALARVGLSPATLCSYQALLAGAELPSEPFAVLRIDSPGQNFDVEKGLIAAGAEIEDDEWGSARIDASAARSLLFDKGRIFYPRQWYLGFRALLARCSTLPNPVMNHPDEIAQMFDKRLCHALCEANDVPVPPSLGPIKGYEQLRTRMAESGHTQVFIKLACGSSASGVVAYGLERAGEFAFTSTEQVGERFYNSRRIRRYTKHTQIAPIVDFICGEGAQVEAWFPKAAFQGKPFDLRVLVIAGQARHLVLRLGRSPMTNLHLGNMRGDVPALLARIGQGAWQKMQRSCEAAAMLFPRSLYCGVDLLVAPNFQDHAILEINAFGDLLPGITWQGRDSYSSELDALLERGAR